MNNRQLLVIRKRTKCLLLAELYIYTKMKQYGLCVTLCTVQTIKPLSLVLFFSVFLNGEVKVIFGISPISSRIRLTIYGVKAKWRLGDCAFCSLSQCFKLLIGVNDATRNVILVIARDLMYWMRSKLWAIVN